MSVKSVMAKRLEKARVFAESVRAVYEGAYNKATEMRKSSINELMKEIPPRVRTAVEGGLQSAQTALDEFNQSLADKAIPSFRKGAVTREQLDQKTKGMQKEATEDKAEWVAQASKVKAKAITKSATVKVKAKVPSARVKVSNANTNASGVKSVAPKSKVARKTKVKK